MKSPRVWIALLLVVVVTLSAESAIDGTWHFRYDTEAGIVDTTSTFKTNGEKLILVTGDEEKVVGTFKEGAIEFAIPDGLPDVGFAADLVVTARLVGGRITGCYEFLDYAGPVVGRRKQ